MNGYVTLEGTVVASNAIRCMGRIVHCWVNDMAAAVAPQPLDLSGHAGQVVRVSGNLHGDLWNASFEKVVIEDGYREIGGEVIGFNSIQGTEGTIHCYRHGMIEAVYLPLNLMEYMGRSVTVAGELHGSDLYKAHLVAVQEPTIGGDPAKEAASLNDLLRIRAANRERIEAVNGNLGTALGFKWTGGERTDHPTIIIFVPQKMAPGLVPEGERAPQWLEDAHGNWCLTDVVTGGKAESLEDFEPLSELSQENRRIVQELRSGRIGLIGGMQLAFYGDGVRDITHSFVGTAGIAVRHRGNGQTGFLTNQHVADAPGREIFHPWHEHFSIGYTHSTLTAATDQTWYEGTIDEAFSYVRCDCGFVSVTESLAGQVRPGLHVIGETGPLLRTDAGTMDVIGRKVISIGRTRGVQRGTVVAYAYEYQDDFFSRYTDFLIIGEDGKAFSSKGDSGKIIVTDDDEHRPLALLWGGWQERLRHGREQEKWTYAIDLDKVLDRLDLELLA